MIHSILSHISALRSTYPLGKLLFTADDGLIPNPFIPSWEVHANSVANEAITAEVALGHPAIKTCREAAITPFPEDAFWDDVVKAIREVRFLDGSTL